MSLNYIWLFCPVHMCFIEESWRCNVLRPVSTGKPKRDENGNTVEDEFSQMPLIQQFFSRMRKEVDYYKRVCAVPQAGHCSLAGQWSKRNCLLADDSWTISREAAARSSSIPVHTASIHSCAGADWCACSSWLDGKQEVTAVRRASVQQSRCGWPRAHCTLSPETLWGLQ